MVKIHILDAGHGDCLLVDCDGVGDAANLLI